jgi:hypothetical protein
VIPDHWSASKFMTWERCPSEFERIYVHGEYDEPHEAPLFGSAVHQGLEAHYNGADGVRAFRGAWKAMRQEYQLSPPEQLTGVGMDLVELVIDQGWRGEPERVFTLDTTSAWGAPTVGAIDLVCEDGLVVRDFKTTSGEWGWERAERDWWQPVLYAWATHERYGVWPDFEYVVLNKISRTLSLFHFDGEEVLRRDEEIQDRAAVIVARVRNDDFACHGQHGFCLECGAKWQHGHVCDMNVVSQRVSSATRANR